MNNRNTEDWEIWLNVEDSSTAIELMVSLADEVKQVTRYGSLRRDVRWRLEKAVHDVDEFVSEMRVRPRVDRALLLGLSRVAHAKQMSFQRSLAAAIEKYVSSFNRGENQ